MINCLSEIIFQTFKNIPLNPQLWIYDQMKKLVFKQLILAKLYIWCNEALCSLSWLLLTSNWFPFFQITVNISTSRSSSQGPDDGPLLPARDVHVHLGHGESHLPGLVLPSQGTTPLSLGRGASRGRPGVDPVNCLSWTWFHFAVLVTISPSPSPRASQSTGIQHSTIWYLLRSHFILYTFHQWPRLLINRSLFSSNF